MSEVDDRRHATDALEKERRRAAYAIPRDEISDDDDRSELENEQWAIASHHGWAMNVEREG